MNKMIEKVFNIGGYSEDTEFTIIKNYEARIDSDRDKCKHAGDTITRVWRRYDGYEKDEYFCVIPNVVLAFNEGGHNCTYVCADCINEALESMKAEDKPSDGL